MVRFTAVSALLALLGLAPTAQAGAVLSFAWDGCEGPVHRTPSGPGHYSLYVTETGMDQPHWAWEVRLHYAAPGGSVPDAWRFDQTHGACKGSSLAEFKDVPRPAEAAACPALHGNAEFLNIQAIRQRIDGDEPSIGADDNVLLMAQAYRSAAATTDPNKRYFLFRVDFDHEGSVKGTAKADSTCGGFEKDIVFQPVAEHCNYLVKDDAGERHEIRFELPPAPLTFGNAVTASKWGRIKSQLPR